MRKRRPNHMVPVQRATAKAFGNEKEYLHMAKKCKGCPYGYKRYCVGVCWKDIYKGYTGSKKK